MNKNEFFSELKKLEQAQAASDGNVGCVNIQACKYCVSVMFCNDCERCYKATHCNRCKDSSYVTHCSDCKNCYSSAYCEQCDNLTNCKYLVLSSHCTECNYCFGCIGLDKKDFHILNKPYSRSEYFKIVKELRGQIGLK